MSSVIDWDFTVASPLQKAATWPKLLQYTPGAVPYGHSDRLMSHPADQAMFLQLLREKERQRNCSETVANLVETSYERNFFELSLQMKTVHQESVKAHPPSSEQYKAALRQLSLVQPRISQEYHCHFENVRRVLLNRIRDAHFLEVVSTVGQGSQSVRRRTGENNPNALRGRLEVANVVDSRCYQELGQS